MKTNSLTRRAGFTLIELLIVISIIAILAGMAVPAANMVMTQARKTQAKTTMVGLVNAIKSYQTEYNRFPQDSTVTTETAIQLTAANNSLMKALKPDQTAAAPALNPRMITFFDPPIAKNDTLNGLTSTYALLDPWGKPFWVLFDFDGDEQLKSPYFGIDSNEKQYLPTTVIAWSYGPDMVQDTAGGKSDDVKSWK